MTVDLEGLVELLVESKQAPVIGRMSLSNSNHQKWHIQTCIQRKRAYEASKKPFGRPRERM